MNKKQFGKLLKKTRTKMGKTQTEMAKRWGISQSNYSKFENGLLEPGGAAIWDLIEMTTKLDLKLEITSALNSKVTDCHTCV